jgi:hypothetical protein
MDGIDGTKVSVLQLRRPKVRDMLGVEKSVDNDAEKEIQLFANLCELTPENLLDSAFRFLSPTLRCVVPLLYRVKQSHHYAVVGLEILLKLTHHRN